MSGRSLSLPTLLHNQQQSPSPNNSAEGMQPLRAACFTWRTAPQPDIVRAAQKDDLYLQQGIDACYDAVMRMFGAVPALQHSKSCKLLATFVYYALTTGAGLQTLGEEYCDIMQITGQQLRLPAANGLLQQQQQQQQQLAGGLQGHPVEAPQ
ncbi:hypothetical protein COO60DRAFT_1517426, partial [Scenedesmus sp. NREL 46B-D3]